MSRAPSASSIASAPADSTDALLFGGDLTAYRRALVAVEAYAEAGRQAVAARVGNGDGPALEREQYATHALAWTFTYVAALKQMLAWAEGLADRDALGEAAPAQAQPAGAGLPVT